MRQKRLWACCRGRTLERQFCRLRSFDDDDDDDDDDVRMKTEKRHFQDPRTGSRVFKYLTV